MQRKRLVVIGLLSLLVLLLANCTAPAAPAQPAADAPAAAEPAAAAGDVTFTVAASADIDTADPHISQLLLFNNVIRLNVFNSLVRYAPNLDLEPDLAESWSNPDDKTYIFNLRQG
ncbi:MAG: hypothetical protein KDE31_22115, partial [Caldilineaceae bacterium]|nr:hypothetical protein [Caldilineaceae bacterium]